MEATKEYYDTRAPEYDEWYLGVGRFASRERPGWSDAVEALERAVATLAPARTLGSILDVELLCEAHMLAAKGDRAALPAVSPRRG